MRLTVWLCTTFMSINACSAEVGDSLGAGGDAQITVAPGWEWVLTTPLEDVYSSTQDARQLGGQEARKRLGLPPAFRPDSLEHRRHYIATFAALYDFDFQDTGPIHLYAWMMQPNAGNGIVTISGGQHRLLALIHRARVMGLPPPTIADIPTQQLELHFQRYEDATFKFRQKEGTQTIGGLYHQLFGDQRNLIEQEYGVVDHQYFESGQWFIETMNGFRLVFTDQGWQPANTQAFVESFFSTGQPIENSWGTQSEDAGIRVSYTWTTRGRYFPRSPCPLGDRARAGHEDEECFDLTQTQGVVSRFRLISGGGKLVERYEFSWQESPAGSDALQDCSYVLARYFNVNDTPFFVARPLTCESTAWAKARRVGTYVLVAVTAIAITKAMLAKLFVERSVIAVAEKVLEKAAVGALVP